MADDRIALVDRESHADLLRFIAEGTAGVIGEEFFRSLVRHLAAAFDVDSAFVAERVHDEPEHVRFISCWHAGAPVDEEIEYDTEGMPCAEVVGADLVWYPDRLIEAFPDDIGAVEAGLEGYLAVPMHGAGGRHLGHVGVTHSERLEATPAQIATLKIFAARAAAEIERRRNEEAMRRLADGHAALRRVATLVAAGAPARDVFGAVTSEAGRLLDAQVANTCRYDDDGDHATIVGTWAAPGHAAVVADGDRVPLDSETAIVKVRRTGRFARVDDFSNIEGELAEFIRSHGLRSSLAAPIEVQRRLWGVIIVSRKTEELFEPHAEHRLGDFAELVAQAIANAEAQDELAASRARLVEAGDRERRRLERNLHDGAQQRLVSLALTLRTVQSRLGDDQPAGRLLADASQQLTDALGELRELARGIHPAILSDCGLGPALEALISRGAIPAQLLAVPAERLPEAVEVAAYYLVAESLTNAAKHARASGATVSVRREGARAIVEVADDGVGGASLRAGSGLRGLADRVEALGGRFELVSPPGKGTVARAEIPC